jgi:hypothetical protein
MSNVKKSADSDYRQGKACISNFRDVTQMGFSLTTDDSML